MYKRLDVAMKHLMIFILSAAWSLTALDAHAGFFLIDDGLGGTGGDCTVIGDWDGAARSCTLTTDVADFIVLLSAGLTLDCADPSTGQMHSISGLPGNIGIFAGADEAVVQNCDVSDFLVGFLALGTSRHRIENSVFHDNRFAGLFFRNADGSQVHSNHVRDNGVGVQLFFCDSVSVMSNVFLRNRFTRAVHLVNSTGGMVAENTFIDNGFGIALFAGGEHEIRDNLFTGNGFPQVLPAGVGPRAAIVGEDSNNNVLTGNVMNGNAYGFGLVGTGNSVDTTNTVDGHPIYWFNELNGVDLTPAQAPGAAGVYCDSCTDVTIQGFDLSTPMGVAIGLYETTGSTVEDNVIENSSAGVLLTLGSDDNQVSNNEISLHSEDVFAYGIRLFGADGNAISDNSIDLGPGNSGWHGISLGRAIFAGGVLDPADWNRVSGNSIRRVLQPAIEVSGSHNLIENNVMRDTGGGIFVGSVLVPRTDNVLEGNTIKDGRAAWFPFSPSPGSFGHGIDVMGAENTLIARNTITGMRDNGLRIQDSIGTEVTRNDIYDNAMAGVDSDGNPIFEVKSLDASGLTAEAIELSVGGVGNYWGRNCGGGLDGAPLFQPGIDSNDASVVDNHPFKHPVAAIPPIDPPPQPMGCP